MAQEAENGGATNGATAAPVVVFSSLKPQLLVEATKANDAVEFYKSAFGAEEVSRAVNPKRKADQEMPRVLSAEVKLGGSTFVVSDIADDSDAPVKSVGTGFTFCLETDDVTAAVAKAVAAGAVSEGEIAESENECFGGVVGKLKDPYGYVWMICSPAKKIADSEAKKIADVEA